MHDSSEGTSKSYPFEILPGPERRPIAGLAVNASVVLLCLVVAAVGIVSWSDFGSNFRTDSPFELLIFFGCAAGLALASPFLWKLFKIGQRMRRPGALEVLQDDPRDPILFLRSFQDDDLPDAALTGLLHTIEERLTEALEPLGPMICIGRPGEPHPELGGARFYVPDRDWQRAVTYFLDRAAAVVIVVGASEGVLWEVDQAMKRVEPSRLLLSFPYIVPKTRRSWWLPFARLIKNFRYSSKMLDRMSEERESRYRLFRSHATAKTSLGLPESPGHAIFLDFLEDGTARLLPSRPHVLMVNRRPEELNVQPDFERTIRPFLEKAQGRPVKRPVLESFLTNRKAVIRAMWGVPVSYAILIAAPLGSMDGVEFVTLPLFIGLFLTLRWALRALDRQEEVTIA